MQGAEIRTAAAQREVEEVEAALDALASLDGPLLPILHRLMERLGRIPPEAVPRIARALDLSRAEVHGVVTYYADFRSEPLAPRVVEVCRAEACQSRGGQALLERARARTGCRADALRADDGRFSVLPVDCLGLCASAPALRVDGALHARVTPDRLDALLDAPPGPRRSQPEAEATDETDGTDATGTTDATDAFGARIAADAASPQAATPGDRARGRAAEASVRAFLSLDAAARAAGADAVASALVAAAQASGIALELVRTSSRGAFWLEPLLEVETADGRVGYGPLTPDDVASLVAAGGLKGRAHPRGVGAVEAIPFLARQRRQIFARAGKTRPLSLDDYRAEGGLRGLRAALESPPEAIREAVLESGLRGRGGAAFPAGIKWRTVAETPASLRYVVCNADEGDSGTFADRMLLEGDPYLLIEGMTIAALAVGATKGFVYVRSEYPDAVRTLRAAIARARDAGWLGPSVLGRGPAFELEVRVGAGSYVCGEETAMLESLEGRRGIVRAKPPLPAVRGLFGKPTLIQNALTFAAVPAIVADGAAAYRALGVGRSTGTMPFQLAGNVRRGGLVELPFGATLRELVFDFGGGTATGRPVKAIQVGGPLGCYVPASSWDVPLDYERYAAMGAGIGHGGIVVHDDEADLAGLARHAMDFCARESCGKCTPCRIGSTRGVELIDRITAESRPEKKREQVALLRDLCATMIDASLCAMGGMTPLPVLSALDHYAGDFGLSADSKDAADSKEAADSTEAPGAKDAPAPVRGPTAAR